MTAQSLHALASSYTTAPQSDAWLEAQQAAIGVMLLDADAAHRLAPHLAPHHFGEPAFSAIAGAIDKLRADGKRVDAVTVKDAAPEAVEALGGFHQLVTLMDQAPITPAIVDHAAIVTDQYARREMARLCGEAFSDDGPATEVLSRLKGQLEALACEAAPEPTTAIDARSSALAMLAEKVADQKAGRMRGAATSLHCFDRRLGGLVPGCLLVIGGRPSMGKTALMRSAMYGAARNQPGDLFGVFSLEMDDAEVSERAVSELSIDEAAPVETDALHKGLVKADRLVGLIEAADAIPSNLLIDCRGSVSVDDVRKAVWAWKRKGKLRAVAIDYLQLMRRPRSDGRNDAAVIGQMTRELKQLARDAQICIVLLSQLSRQVEQREDKRPTMADLRESGTIEQDANVVLFPYREAYYLERAEVPIGKPGRAEWEMAFYGCRTRLDVICAKVRQGSIGTDVQEYEAAFDAISNPGERR
ncbi:replicative DNA helicase [Brevundimonas sp.]|uniref:replicative DNA helicase n=1 Tax=Brevundimonas sp. TaxID=1871086 RepID=UPI002D613458|nr:DnaB-like helicase C-terminal domain-containing protein [Brevundimonas sp.]HYC98487.1 DnaB-like helicase C-terminal domain-containing protein [Brevundimonas sp.]